MITSDPTPAPLTDADLAKLRASIGARYVVLPQSEAPDDAPGLRDRDDADWLGCVVRVAADGSRTTVGYDGGEPEDQTLSRDWRWVAPALSEIGERRDSEVARLLDEVGRLRDELARMRPCCAARDAIRAAEESVPPVVVPTRIDEVRLTPISLDDGGSDDHE